MATVNYTNYVKSDVIDDGLVAGEALTGGDHVYIKSDGTGVFKALNTGIATTAIGSVRQDVAVGGRVQIYRKYTRDDKSGLTVGARLFLSNTAGADTQTLPTTATRVVQPVGVAITATKALYDFSQIPMNVIQATGNSTVAYV